jgi:glycosyltransferase involved in cell wall biosynthesis
LQKFEESKNPKISLIVPIFNQEKNILSFYMSIYNQSLKDIEIIFINDASTDHSCRIIEHLMENDKRIVLLRNESDKRTFYQKTKGIFKSRGEYVLILEPDDLLLNNILEKSYETAKKNNLDILQYYLLIGNNKVNRVWENLKCQSGIIHASQIKKFFYNCRSPNILDKLIKRQTFIRAMKYFIEEYNDDRFDYSDDDLTFFGLSQVTESYGFLEEVGYFYSLQTPWETNRKIYKNKNINRIFLKFITIMKNFLKRTQKNRKEKLWGYKYFIDKLYNLRDKLQYLDRHFDYFNNVLDRYLRSKYFKKEEKQKIMFFKDEVNRIKMKKMNNTVNVTVTKL